MFLHDYRTLGELRRGLKEFIDFFNGKRLHQGLVYQTPDAVYYGAFPIKEMEQRVA
ncbi:MAG: transposase [Ruminococcaceae bacterium]|nr:transposase [Oscillospiraceae bacterium]